MINDEEVLLFGGQDSVDMRLVNGLEHLESAVAAIIVRNGAVDTKCAFRIGVRR